MKKVKARVVQAHWEDDNEVIVFIAGMWRAFGTPYRQCLDNVQFYSTPKSAKRGAERVAKALGIKLEWED